MARYTPVKISTVELAALAFAAYRKNQSNVYKDSSFFDKEKDALVAVVPNKQLMREGNLEVVEQDRIDAQAAMDALSQDRMMRILKGLAVPDFQNTLTNLLKADRIHHGRRWTYGISSQYGNSTCSAPSSRTRSSGTCTG